MNGMDWLFVIVGAAVVAVLTVIVMRLLGMDNAVTVAGGAAGGVAGALTAMFVKRKKAAGTARADG